MPSTTRQGSKTQAFTVSLKRATRWTLNRLPTFMGGLIAVLILRYFLGEPLYPLYTLGGLVALIVTVIAVGTVIFYLRTVLSDGTSKEEGP